MDRFIHFMQSITGRTVRILIGLVLIALGAVVFQDVWGAALTIIGVIPAFAGATGICLLAPLFGYTLDGQKRTRATGV